MSKPENRLYSDSEMMLSVAPEEEDLRSSLHRSPKNVVLLIGVHVEGKSEPLHFEITFERGLLESLNVNGKTRLITALQKAAEYVAARMADNFGRSGVA